MSQPAPEGAHWVVLGGRDHEVALVSLDRSGAEAHRALVPPSALAEWIDRVEHERAPRWVWNDTALWYPELLAAGVRVARAHDLRLCHAILRDTALRGPDDALRRSAAWDAAQHVEDVAGAPALFEIDGEAAETSSAAALPTGIDAILAEFSRQRAGIEASTAPGRLRLLVAAESAGALVATELRAAGLPWDEDAHRTLLDEVLGAVPAGGGLPATIQDARDRAREALGDPEASLDSQPKLLRSLHRAGILVRSTSRWELSQHDHPAVQPLLEYKRLSRLMSANGRAWLAEWVSDGRFRPTYVPAGSVTGRWASSGGGALQLPRQLRTAVRADPGWTLISADVAQLEPRVLAAMAGDTALADAARGRDLYAGVVSTGAVLSRSEAKIAMLGAMYGATSGESGRLVPRLRRTFPRAMALVDEAARTGEDGGVVTTWLGRSSPEPSLEWQRMQARASQADSSHSDETRARRAARERGRFTRNFVVQGTAAEWALAWLADLRTRLALIPPVADVAGTARSGPVFATRPHLAFFLHDEVIVHVPRESAELAATAVRDAAATAGRLLFADFPVDFPLDLHISERAEKD